MLRRRVQMVLLVYVLDYWTAPEHLQLNPQKRCSCLVSKSLLCLSFLFSLHRLDMRLILTRKHVLSLSSSCVSSWKNHRHSKFVSLL